jgi:hypothetical protein
MLVLPPCSRSGSKTALLDSWYDPHLGVVTLLRVREFLAALKMEG